MLVGCACATAALSGDGGGNELVKVVSEGSAGIYDYSVLGAADGTALATWLDNEGFTLPDGATAIFDGYIEDGRLFLAIRLNETVIEKQTIREIPPIQVTVETTERFYPIAISSISAAEETDVLMYLWAPNRQVPSDFPTAEIDENLLHVVDGSPSGTNYEELFRLSLDENGSGSVVVEYAAPWEWSDYSWNEAPAGVRGSGWLTRLRTILSPDEMIFDYYFTDAVSNEGVDNLFIVY